MVTKEELIAFEEDIAQCFNNKMIKAPIHLASGNEDQTTKIFQYIEKDDWVCGTWRSHFMCLLKGVPKELLKQKILEGKSIGLCFKEYKIICSAIVGGNLSIAIGLAWGEKLKGNGNKVWCFLGDMAAATGAFEEAQRYSVVNELPVTWIIEDNGVSVLTPTEVVWGKSPWGQKGMDYFEFPENKLIYYKYKNTKYPHAGAGIRVSF